MLDDSELLLARLAVNFRYVTQAQIDVVLAEAEATKTPLASLLISHNLCNEQKLQMLQSIQGASPGQLVVQEKREAVTRQLFCAYCDNEATIPDFEERQTYQCERCGAVLQKERPTKRISARDRERSPLAGPGPLPPKPIKPAPKKVAVFCPVCDAEDQVENFSPDKAIPCKECGATMVADEPAGSNETDEIPVLQTLGLSGEIETKTVGVEKAERNAQQKRNLLRLQRAREQLRLNAPDKAFADLSMLCQDVGAPPEAHLLRAEVGIQLGELDSAAASCEALVKQKFFLSDAYTLQGQIQFVRENYRKAIAELDMALEESGGNILAVLLHGACLQRLHKLTQARQDFERAIALAQGRDKELSSDIQAMLRQAASFIQTGKLELFGPIIEEADSATVKEHAKDAAEHLKHEDAYLAAREFRRAGNNEKAKELFAQLLEPGPIRGRLIEAARENGFEHADAYRDLVVHEALAEIAKDARDMGQAAVHLTLAARACLGDGRQQERGADDGLMASTIFSQLNNSIEAERSFGVAAELMSWPNVAIRAWVEELPRENINCTLTVELTNIGKGNARNVRIQTGEYLRFERELRFPDLAPGEVSTREVEFKATRRSKELISEFKLFFRDAGSDRQLTRGVNFTFDVLPSYEATRRERVYWIGAPSQTDPHAASSASSLILAPEVPARGKPSDTDETISMYAGIPASLVARLDSLDAKLDRLTEKLDRLADAIASAAVPRV